MAKKKTSNAAIASTRHKDKRVNIPTRELRDFVAADEAAPGALLYPRDPSLDPQLVWQGKDEQDRAELSVPVVPLYIQEKIHPHVLIEAIKAEARTAAAEAEAIEAPDMFGDFNGLPKEFEDRVNFYNHEANQNRLILGDSVT